VDLPRLTAFALLGCLHRIELTQSLSNNPDARDCLSSSSFTNFRKQAFDVVSK
jgi:hypothetical protein